VQVPHFSLQLLIHITKASKLIILSILQLRAREAAVKQHELQTHEPATHKSEPLNQQPYSAKEIWMKEENEKLT